MDFSFTEEQEMLRTSAKDFLAKECPKTKVRELEKSEQGYDPEMWRKMAELGWTGLVFPEEYGGTGGEIIDLVILAEEMGRNILPGPFFSTVVLCSLPILEYGTEEQKEKFLKKVADGEMLLALALTESLGIPKASAVELCAIPSGEDYILEGTKLFVGDANVADYLLVAARTGKGQNPEEEITLFLVDAKAPGIKVEVIPTIAGDKQCEVTFDKVNVSKKDILGEVDHGWNAVEFLLHRAALVKCAETLGASEAVLDMAVTYAKERFQFDKPIGSFQAIQHKLADMMMDVEGLRYLVHEAAWRMSEGIPSDLEISITKAKANQVYQRISLDGIQIHGTIGVTDDHDIGLYFRRVKAAEFALGDSEFHREKIAQEIGL